MDISAAKDVINMYTEMLNYTKVDGYEQAVSEAEALLRMLPDFMYDESGAVKEWSMKEYGENNAHRHISHLYPAWPALQTQHDSKLASACRQAIINRNHENKGKDDTASHGWIHKALVEARLKMQMLYMIRLICLYTVTYFTQLYLQTTILTGAKVYIVQILHLDWLELLMKCLYIRTNTQLNCFRHGQTSLEAAWLRDFVQDAE